MAVDSPLNLRSLSLDHHALSQMLAQTENILIIQDLDGVCMGLVKDPLTREIEPRYLAAAKLFGEHFYVLTNGEHIGKRGVNNIVLKALGDRALVREQGLYLQGLAAGGVQWQDRYGSVEHPGVSNEEMAFLSAVPAKMTDCLRTWGQQPKYGFNSTDLETYIQATVLDNQVSPTVNLNVFHEIFRDRPQFYAELQQAMQSLMEQLLQEAAAQGLTGSFFVHYAPNLGRDNYGQEIMQPSQGQDSGTTDFQFMLRGGVKEVGVLVILNYYYFCRTGNYPLGQDFNARQAPRQPSALLQLVKDNFAPELMPSIVGVGDTVTSKAIEKDDQLEFKRGGSDRGFLELIQALGQEFQTHNVVVYVDSSGGEVKNRQPLKLQHHNGTARVVHGPGDSRDKADPLTLNVVFPQGHSQYIDFFESTANKRVNNQSP